MSHYSRQSLICFFFFFFLNISDKPDSGECAIFLNVLNY